MIKIILVAVFGALGALSRYGIGAWAGTRSFPYATMAINVAGSFFLGFVLTVASQRLRPELATGLAVGFLGAFTTFSTLSWDTFGMLRDNRPLAAAINIGVSLLLGISAAGCGYWVAARFVNS